MLCTRDWINIKSLPFKLLSNQVRSNAAELTGCLTINSLYSPIIYPNSGVKEVLFRKLNIASYLELEINQSVPEAVKIFGRHLAALSRNSWPCWDLEHELASFEQFPPYVKLLLRAGRRPLA